MSLMHTTDYSQIARRYDLNPIRKRFAPEKCIAELLAASKSPLALLDLACGTGNYLESQHAAYGQQLIRWFGCDLSAEMLAVARTKVGFAELVECDAQSLPYQDGAFDVIAINFAFHHFRDKRTCLREAHRTLKVGGYLLMHNICPEEMPDWWVYRYFPSTRVIDNERFWTEDHVRSEMEALHFEVSRQLEYERDRTLSDHLFEARNREVSQLTLLPESEYSAGLKTMEADSQKGVAYAAPTVLIHRTCRRLA